MIIMHKRVALTNKIKRTILYSLMRIIKIKKMAQTQEDTRMIIPYNSTKELTTISTCIGLNNKSTKLRNMNTDKN